MQLTKHHALGNDFLVALVEEAPPDAATLARRWCHRRTGIGADGLIFSAPVAGSADASMVLFNSDGSSAEISGNGIRCLAQAIARTQGLDMAGLQIKTAGCMRTVAVRPGSVPDEVQVTVHMGAVTDGPSLPKAAMALRPGLDIIRAETGAIGNPHVVIQVDDLGALDPAIDGPAIEALWKPTGINVHFLAHTGPDEITLRHWERGAGATLACGSGAAVAASIAHQWGLVGEEVSVAMPGGAAVVRVGEDTELEGPSVYVATIEPARIGSGAEHEDIDGRG